MKVSVKCEQEATRPRPHDHHDTLHLAVGDEDDFIPIQSIAFSHSILTEYRYPSVVLWSTIHSFNIWHATKGPSVLLDPQWSELLLQYVVVVNYPLTGLEGRYACERDVSMSPILLRLG